MASIPEARDWKVLCGGSCGVNPYRTAMQVYQDKTSEDIEEIDNEALRQGREFEDYVARRFQKQQEERSDVPMQCFITKNILLCLQM